MPVRSRRLWLLLLVLAVPVCLVWGCGGVEGPPPLEGDHEFTLVVSQANFGQIEPCSCNNRTIGGFPRRFAYLKSLRDSGRHVVCLDAGNSLFSERFQSPAYTPQARRKAHVIADAFVRCGIDGMTFGELDLSALGDFLQDTVEHHHLPMLAANVVLQKTGEPLFEGYRIIEADGVKIAVIGLVAMELKRIVSHTNREGVTKTTTDKNQRVQVQDMFENRDVRVLDPIEVAQKLVAKLRGQAHLVCILSHLTPRQSRELPTMVPGIDLVIGSHVPATKSEYSIVGNSLLVSAPMNGTGLSVLHFKVRNGDLLFQDHTEVARYGEGLPRLRELRETLASKYREQELGEDGVTAATRVAHLDELIASREAIVNQAETSQRSRFMFESIILDGKQHKDDPEMSELVRQYRISLAELYADPTEPIDPAVRFSTEQPSYTRIETCRVCHQAQDEFWRGTEHAHAWQTMLDYEVQYDLECIKCHSLGYMLPGGYDRPDRVAGLEDVQCEHCHGAGSGHVDGISFLRKGRIVAEAANMTCEQCHNAEHSPDFERETYLPRVTCPPVDRNEPVIRGVLGKARESLEELVDKKQQDAGALLGLIDLELRLQNYQRALELAEDGAGRFPDVLRIQTAKALALDGLSRTAEALDLMNGLYEQHPANQPVVTEFIGLLVNGHDPEARDCEVADELLEYAFAQFGSNDSALLRLRAESLHAQGRLDDALTVMRTMIFKMKLKTSDNIALLAAWLSEAKARTEYRLPPPLATPPQ